MAQKNYRIKQLLILDCFIDHSFFFDWFTINRYVLVIGFLSPHVRHAVDAEGYIQIYAESEVEAHPE